MRLRIAASAYLYDNAFGVLSDGYLRTYVRLSALPVSTSCAVIFAASAGTEWQIRVSQTGQILILDSSASTQATSSATVTAGQFFRLEAHHNLTGQLSVRLFLSMDSDTPTETLTAGSGTEGNVSQLFFTNGVGAGLNVWHDDIVAGASGWPGSVNNSIATDVATVSIGPGRIDSAVGTDSSSVSGIKRSVTDSAAGTDLSVGSFKQRTSSAVGTDASTLRVSLPRLNTFYDSFERTVSAGTNFDSADVGGDYTPLTTTNGTAVSVSTGAGRIQPASAPKTFHQILLDEYVADTTVTAQVSFSTVATGAQQEVSVFARSDATAANYYALDLVVKSTDGHLWMFLEKNTLAARSDIGNVDVDLGAYTPGQKWWIELRCVGTTQEVRAWIDGGTRPSVAQATSSDTAFATGSMGLRGRLANRQHQPPRARLLAGI